VEHRLDGVGDELRGLGVDGDVPAEQHTADDLARVPGRILRIGIHVSAPSSGSRTRWCGARRRLGDLGHGVLPLAVRAGGGVHAADGGGLPVVQLGLAASRAAAGPGRGQALPGALDD
jgi:hypothetical protein